MAKTADAEAAAHKYVRDVPHLSQQNQHFAYEDFVAGYVANSADSNQQLEFVTHQLKQLEDIAAREGEFYSLSVVRYTLEWLTRAK
jgi:hypothetical protein